MIEIQKRKLNPKEIAEIYLKYPAPLFSHQTILIEKLDTGQKKLFMEINNKKYLVVQSRSNHDTWYEIQNGS